MLSITEEIAVPHPPQRVWEVVSSPQDVVSCIGGAELGPSHDDGSFDGTLVVRFGGIRVKFGARVSLDLDEPGHEGRLSARGKDGQGATRFGAHATFRVVAGESPGTSVVSVDGEVQLNGKLAKLIESGAGAVISRMTKEFSEQLIRKCAPPGEPVTRAAAGPHAAQTARQAPGQASARRAGLLARLRAWWSGRRSRRQPQPPVHAGSANTSGEALGRGGRR
ncbi:SRPBCC domain-containing protein [Streptomyces justiciae]|uniref:SRPBCC domain-containing protein n=1 Tax=Streptomyces justiciae TaxID=2780140 RepID=A0ABU3M7Z4_9ACTN|nr:SRPBCC domain-containing protein [Streptomyces justiciae]MDT7847555.1 SRPBCC domain-containing protein [Streptomyces justiciae]